MPRKARNDAPDAVHHIMAPGIERGKIFRNEVDRDDFLGRLEHILSDTTIIIPPRLFRHSVMEKYRDQIIGNYR